MFRIDRQYVTLLPEKSRYGTGYWSEEDELLSQEELRKMREDTQIFVERMLEDAKRRADLIINEGNVSAGIIAQTMQKKAQEEREHILAETRKEAEELKDWARREGHALGMNQAEAEAKARNEQEKQRYQELMDSANRQRDDMIDELEGGIYNLVLDIVKKVIHVKLEESDEVFQGLVQDMIAEFHAAEDLTVRVNPSDYVSYFGPDWKPQGRRPDDGRVMLMQDEELHPGDCKIESETAMIDCGVDKQLDAVEKALLGD